MKFPLYDEKCLDLARYFYPKMSETLLGELAGAIQQVVEDFSLADTGEESASAPAGPRDGLPQTEGEDLQPEGGIAW